MERTSDAGIQANEGSSSCSVPSAQGEGVGSATRGDGKIKVPPHLNPTRAKIAAGKHKRYKQYMRGSSTRPAVNELIRMRQQRGRMRFVSRTGAGVWSPDPLQQAMGRYPHFLRRMKLSAVLKGHEGCVNTISATPDGKYWITGSDDLKVKVRCRWCTPCFGTTFCTRFCLGFVGDPPGELASVVGLSRD